MNLIFEHSFPRLIDLALDDMSKWSKFGLISGDPPFLIKYDIVLAGETSMDRHRVADNNSNK